MDLNERQKRRIKYFLIRYMIANGIKGEHYSEYITQKAKLKPDEEGKMPLNSRDPRNWIVDNIEPGPKKLEAYLQFIKIVDSDFELGTETDAEYVNVGLMLSKFTRGPEHMVSPSLVRQARDLSGKVFVSTSEKEGTSRTPSETLCTILSVQAVTDTPFLIVQRFAIGKFQTRENLSEDTQRLAALAETYYDAPLNNDDLCETIAQRLDAALPEITKEAVSLHSFYRGIVAPVPREQSYHGVLQSAAYLPDHIVLKVYCTPNDDIVGARQMATSTSPHLRLQRVDNLGNIKIIFQEYGEPKL